MSVQIYGFRGLEKISDEQAEDEFACVHVAKNQDFPGRCDDVEDGFYKYSDVVLGADLAYSRYSRMRDTLAQLAGYPKHQDPCDPIHGFSESAWDATEGPFWELINFSDCEGSLGTATCKKLAADFASFHAKALVDEKRVRMGETAPISPFLTFYEDMKRMFEFASDGGVVVFS